MRPELVVTDDPAGAAAERLSGASGQLVVTGGSTPRSAYEQAATRRADWANVTVWFTDERCVAPDHEQSNYGMLKAALLDRIEGPPPEVHRMQGELSAQDGAKAYTAELRAEFGEQTPAMDLVILGLGPDGHICSLFPGDAALGVRDRMVVGVETPGMAPLVPRVTLTLPVVNSAREVVFLVTGEDKAEAVGRAFSGVADPAVPGSLVEPDSGALTAIVDPAAAAQL
ncbi:MAG: 6-phosphogluconolactonase [Thermoleophilaceae bacterium]